jgi:hypothetical protein
MNGADSGVTNIRQLAEAIRQDDTGHTLGAASAVSELDAIEERLGYELPAPYREFLEQVGAGILYEKHEIFGPRRVMIHDIEFVPDLLSVRQLLESGGAVLRPGMIPVHRTGQTVHLLDLTPGPGHGRVLTLEGAQTHRDFESFLLAVVAPVEGTAAS